MDRRSILTMGAAAGLGLLPRSATAQSKTLKEQIVGDWSLVSWVQIRADGSKNYRFGSNPKGINTFSPAGRFSLVIMQADLPKISSNDPMKPSAEEAEAIVRGSIAYYGTYSVEEATKTLSTQLDGTTLPNQLGIPQKRNIDSIGADELHYSNPTAVGGGGAGKIEVVWKRAKVLGATANISAQERAVDGTFALFGS
jgi:Lipocalin-like domain